MTINSILREILHDARRHRDLYDRMTLLSIRLGQLADVCEDDGDGGLEELLGKITGRLKDSESALTSERRRADGLANQLQKQGEEVQNLERRLIKLASDVRKAQMDALSSDPEGERSEP